ncbi:MAG TPA: N-acetyl-D-Glu racemase DgcA [Candidatus Binatia bacterium]|nr:N-acetyl-D-Glu racemase DgcA [Candidatus Binatia bacterium]
MLRGLKARHERWPLSRPFRISRGEKTAADVVVVEARAGDHVGQGESVPYARYGESIESVLAQVSALGPAFENGLTRLELQDALPPGAARNAMDCALWDLEAKLKGCSVAELIGAQSPAEMVTAVTISLDAPELMADAAARVADAPLIKVKVNGDAPLESIAAVRRAAPSARLIVDPNESWNAALLAEMLAPLANLGVALIEQPLPADGDHALEHIASPIPICADESAHVSADLARVARRYRAVNIKLDKTGGLTEALATRRQAEDMGLIVMVGCMISTSLGIAPALHVAANAQFVDLDGPWWLLQDRDSAVRFSSGRLAPPRNGWGISSRRIA